MKKIAVTILAVTVFILSCDKTNILNPNENEVEVFYLDGSDIVEYRSKTNEVSGAVEMAEGIKFNIKDYKDNFESIISIREYEYDYLTYKQILNNDEHRFILRFRIPFTNLESPYIDMISVASMRQNYFLDSYSNGQMVAKETNNKIVFSGKEIYTQTNVDIEAPFCFEESEFKNYGYLTYEENLILNFIIYSVKLYESLITNNFVKK